MLTIATLYELRQHLAFPASETAEDARLLAALEAASESIERRTRRRFVPRVATLGHDVDLRNAAELLLRDDLLELWSITHGMDESIALEDVLSLPGGALRLLHGEGFRYVDSPRQAVQVTGLWGFHSERTSAWQDSGDTVQNAPFSAPSVALQVTDVLSSGAVPRFQVGHLLRIGQELLCVLAIHEDTQTLTVARGAHGSTAAEHAQGSAITVFRPARDVLLLALRWATWLYKEADSAPDDLPALLLDTLDGFRRISV